MFQFSGFSQAWKILESRGGSQVPGLGCDGALLQKGRERYAFVNRRFGRSNLAV